MTLLLALFLAPPKTPSGDFSRCLATMRRDPAFAVHAELHTESALAKSAAAATLAVRSPSWAGLELVTPAGAGHGALNWHYEVRGRVLRGYDGNRHAYLSRTYLKTLAALPTLVSLLGGLMPDPIQKVMSAGDLGRFFAPFMNLKGWSRTVTADSVVWRDSTPKGRVMFGFDRASGHLTDWKIVGSGITVTWKLTYPSLTNIPPLAIPDDATQVDTFRMPPLRPKFADPVTQKLVDSSFDAYERSIKLGVTMVQDGVVTKIWRDGAAVVQVGPSGGWRWSRGILTVWPKGGVVYEGPTFPRRIRSYLAQLKVDATPIGRAFAGDENYAAKLITNDYSAKRVGEVTFDGVPLQVLQLFGPAVRVDLGIDAQGFIRRIDSTAYDIQGHALSETIRTLSYDPDAKPAAPPSIRHRPLPKLKAPPKPPPLPKKKG